MVLLAQNSGRYRREGLKRILPYIGLHFDFIVQDEILNDKKKESDKGFLAETGEI